MNEVRHRLPQLSESELENLPKAWADYARRLSRGVHEMSKADADAFKTLDRPPVFVGVLTASQTITPNVLTTVQLTSSIDTHGFWDATAYNYRPNIPGFYRCAWAINVHDSVAFAASTYAYSQLDLGGAPIFLTPQYGNGSGLDITPTGSTIVEFDGTTTAITLGGLVFAGSTPSFFYQAGVNRTWLTIDYLGRR